MTRQKTAAKPDRKTRLACEPLEDRVVPAVEFPAGANVVNVPALYGALPDDGIDDTAAVQQALNDYMARDAILYFPDGVYDFSAPLDYALAQRGERGLWLQGQSEAGTVFRWADNLAVFNQVDGSGNPVPVPALDLYNGNSGNAFGNYVHDLTIEIGAGNPGAVGMQYHSNNYGSVRNVTIRSLDPDGVGFRGLDLAFNEPGPWLMTNLTIDGFDTGIVAAPQSYSGVFDGLTLTNQRVYGFGNYRLPVSITNFTSVNSVPAYVSISGFGWGNTVITNANFSGGDPDTFAVVNENANPNGQFSGGVIFLRDVTTSGYKGVIDDQPAGRQVLASAVTEYTTSAPHSVVPGSPLTSLNLPVQTAPQLPADPVANWVSVIDFGANPWDDRDDSDAIQRALDSGAKTVYFPSPLRVTAGGQIERGSYRVGKTLTVGGNVERVAGLYSQITVLGPLYGLDAPLFRVVDGNRDVVQIDGFTIASEGGGIGAYHAFAQDTLDTLVIKDVLGQGYRNGVRGGEVFIENMTGSDLRFAGQRAWLRQINPEETVDRPKIVNDGGDLWILGLKTEGRSTQVETVNGGRTEVLGGQIYTSWFVPADYPAFTTTDGSLSFTLAESNYIYQGLHNTWVRDTRGGVTRDMTLQNTPIDRSRFGAANINLYTDRVVDATAPGAVTNLRVTGTTTNSVTLAWDAAVDAESVVRAYRVYRNGEFIGATGRGVTTFADAGLPDGEDFTYTVVAENAAALRGPASAPVTAGTAADTTRPGLALVAATPYNPTRVAVTFTEPVSPATATAPANYAIDNGVSVTAAALSADGRTVTLTTSPLSPGVAYTLSVSNVTDRATTPNAVVAGTAAAFAYRDTAGGTGLTGTYFPSNNFTGTAVTRLDPAVDFDWGTGSPGVPGIGADLFSVRWTGQVEPRYSEAYTFTMVGDDRIRLVIDGKTVIDRGFYSPNEITGTITLEAGRRYDIEVSVAEDFGGAGARLWWQSASQPREIVPAAQLFPTAGLQTVTVRTGVGRGADSSYEILDGGVRAEYFANNSLSGTPVLTRLEGGITNFWGGGSPAPGVPADNFSVRYTGFVLPQFTEDYVFTAVADDRVRLWVNDELIINRNFYTPNQTDSVPVRLTAGVPATIRMEVEEDFGDATAYLVWRSPSTVQNFPNFLRPDYPDAGTNPTAATTNRLNFSFAASMAAFRFDLAGVDLTNNRVVGATLTASVGAPTSGEESLQTVIGVNDDTPNPLWAESGPARMRWATFPGNQGGNYAFGGPGVSTHLGTLVLDNTGFRLNGVRDGVRFESDELTRLVRDDTDGLVTVVLKRQVPAFFGDLNLLTKEHADGSFAPSLRLTLAPNTTAAPAAVDLLPAFDTGASDGDDLTNRNNATPAAALRFAVSGTTPGAVVTVYADGVAVGSAVATGDTTEVLTFGTLALADGIRTITARQTVLGVESADSVPLAVTIDTEGPTASIARVTPDPRNSPVESVGITFDAPVTGFDLGDVVLTRNGVVVDLAGATLTGSGAEYALTGLTAATAANGNYVLTVRAGGSGIVDADGNPLTADAVETWTTSANVVPRVAGITRLDPNPTNAGTVRYRVIFTDAVTGVDPTDFALTAGKNLFGAAVAGVTGGGSQYTVVVTTGTGNGSLRLDVIDDDSIRDSSNKPLGGVGPGNGNFRKGESYTLDRTAPRVSGIGSVSPNPRKTPVESLTVTFSEAINAPSFDPADLSLTRNGGPNLIGPGVTITQTGTRTFVVGGLSDLTAAAGSYAFTVNATGLADPAGNAGSNSLTRTWVRETPRVLSSVRADPSPTNAAAVTFTVTFSEPVTGVDAADFRPVASANLVGAAVTGVEETAPGIYRVTVGTGTGNGTLRLDFLAPGSGVADLYGNPVVADYTRGQSYTIDRTPPTVRSVTGVSSITDEPVEYLTVNFSEAVNPATFDLADLSLTLDGAPILLPVQVTIVQVSPSSFRVEGLEDVTAANGRYAFTVAATGVLDRAGNAGTGSRTLSWTKTA